MKPFKLLIALVILLISAACGGAQGPSVGGEQLIVTDGSQEKAYSMADLKALPASEATFNGVAYRGVTLSVLLEDAGFDPNAVSSVKPVASDGYSMKYGPDLFLLENTLLAYERVDGPLASDEIPYRMVLPDQEGKLNVRQLVKIEVIP
jgi:DMSO/TMAO reductase YedYZ molybdopterin-dependent catalytic subunit